MINQLKKTICDNLLRIRKAQRFSQQNLADVLNITQPSYRDLEMGQRTISAVQLGLVADFYRIPVDFFYRPDADPRVNFLEETGSLARLREQLEICRAASRIHVARNEELEAKVKRKDRKIDELLDRMPKL